MLRIRTCIVIAILVMLLLPTGVVADVPTNMNVQGRLTDSAGDPVPPGLRIFTFKIYDAETGGTEVWPAAPGEQQTLYADDNGLWGAVVGTFIPLTEAVFQDTSRWLEVTVDDGANPPETLSRIKLNTNPFTYRSASSQQADRAADADNLGGQPPGAYAASGHNHDASYVNVLGDTMTGELVLPTLSVGSQSAWNGVLKLYQVGSGQPVVVGYPFGGMGGALEVRDESGDYTLVHEPDANGKGGYFQVYGGVSSSYLRADGMTNSTDSGLSLYISGTGSSTIFNTNASGNGSVLLPTDAVSSTEILNEPGISQGLLWLTAVEVTGTTNMKDIVTTSITIPAAGYITVEASGTAFMFGATAGDTNYIAFQIDQTPGGGADIYVQFAGFLSSPGPASVYLPLYCQRTYYMSTPATYSFRLEALDASSTSSGSRFVWNPSVRATYYPTSYGAVAAAVTEAEATQFESAELIRPGVERPAGMPVDPPAYTVDLRELEVRALKARAEAERLERELIQARASEQHEIRTQMNSDSK